MKKIRRISQRQLNFRFKSAEEQLEVYQPYFLSTSLGLIHQAIPWQEIIKSFGLRENKKGPLSIFSPQGKIGLMFLKSYTGLSDNKLIEQLNANIDYQLFCGLLLDPTDKVKDYKVVSHIRGELAHKLKVDDTQELLMDYWRDYMKDLDKILTDATCYESSVRYPTSQKLLWESVSWIQKQLVILCKELGIKRPRNKYLDWKTKYNNYSRKRKRRVKEKRSITRGLLKLLNKQIEQIHQLLTQYIILDFDYQQIKIIKKVYQQQHDLFYHQIKPKERIISLHKPYLRPIVRGKEKKSVEFGAKVNKIQIDGINFIEHLSFEAFHEGIRVPQIINKAQKLSKTYTTVLGADAIYATNKNRTYCTKRNIRTDFKHKGKKGKDYQQKKQLSKLITKERASRLEGSFGNEKEHYNLKKINARTQKNEILWIFFGIHTANALNIGRRMTNSKAQKAA